MNTKLGASPELARVCVSPLDEAPSLLRTHADETQTLHHAPTLAHVERKFSKDSMAN